MKRIVSVSLGSSKRDAVAEVELMGERLLIERRGTDGDLNRARELIRSLDGHVDAIGLGGIDLYIFAGQRRYTLRDAMRMASAATKTPVVDGSGLKNSLERRVIRFVQEEANLQLKGKRVLVMSAVDRFGMAEELVGLGCHPVFGDLIFTLGIPVRLQSLRSVAAVARVLAPIAVRLPIRMLYPVGESQERSINKYSRFLEDVDVIAGDFHFIKRNLPQSLEGKGIITNTVTQQDIQMLFERGASYLVTTTPNLGGRSFGTNAIEAALVAISGQRPESLTADDYLRLLDEIEFRPRVEMRGRDVTEHEQVKLS